MEPNIIFTVCFCNNPIILHAKSRKKVFLLKKGMYSAEVRITGKKKQWMWRTDNRVCDDPQRPGNRSKEVDGKNVFSRSIYIIFMIIIMVSIGILYRPWHNIISHVQTSWATAGKKSAFLRTTPLCFIVWIRHLYSMKSIYVNRGWILCFD